MSDRDLVRVIPWSFSGGGGGGGEDQFFLREGVIDTGISKMSEYLAFPFANTGPCLKMILLPFATWYLNILLLGVLYSCLTDVKKNGGRLDFYPLEATDCHFLLLSSRWKNWRLDSPFSPLYFKFCIYFLTLHQIMIFKPSWFVPSSLGVRIISMERNEVFPAQKSVCVCWHFGELFVVKWEDI